MKVLPYAIGSLLLAAGWLAHRGHQHEKRRSRTRSRPLLVTTLILAAAFGLFAEAGLHASESRYSQVAQQVTGRPEVTVQCQRISSGLLSTGVLRGWVNFENGKPTDIAHLDWQTCRDLRAWERNPDASIDDLPVEQVTALHVLTHEAMHLTGVSDESLAECAAIQSDETTALLLGAPTATAAALGPRYLEEMYAYMPDGYRSADCVEDGAMDRTPQDDTWPGQGTITEPVTAAP